MTKTNPLLDSDDASIYEIETHAAGPSGKLPLTDDILRTWSSGDLFGLTQAAGMGWKPEDLLGPQYLLLSTQGGVRAPDGSPIALGYHTGHWEVGLLVQAAAHEIKAAGGVPFAAFCSDPCDGRTQGTTGMFDSLPYRNDAAIVLRRLIRSLPTRRGVLAVWPRIGQGFVYGRNLFRDWGARTEGGAQSLEGLRSGPGGISVGRAHQPDLVGGERLKAVYRPAHQ